MSALRTNDGHLFFLPFLTTALVTAAAACGGGDATTTPVAAPTATASAPPPPVDAGVARQSPPPPSAAKPSPFPAVTRKKLANGVTVVTVEAHALPVVQIRVLVHAGSGNAARPGAVSMTADMLKDGGTKSMTSGELLRRIETMGANLGVSTDFDGTTLSLSITKDHLSEATKLLAEVLEAPRFDQVELGKLKARETDEAEERARSDGQFSAMHEIVRQLFPASNPYSRYGILPSEIAAITPTVIRETYESYFVPKSVEVIVCGDIDTAGAQALMTTSFGSWAGHESQAAVGAMATPPANTTPTIIVTDRPKSAQSDVFVALPAPARNSSDWPDLRVAQQVLGGGISGRLFLDVREQRSLAYSAYARILELASGPQATLLYAGTQTPKTALAVDGLLQNVQKIGLGDIDQVETERARRYLSDVFAVRMETIGAVADLLVVQDELGLPDGYWDTYRSALRGVDPTRANTAAKKLFGGSTGASPIIVVSGDADVIGPMLTRFGDVTVVDPEHEFQRVRTLPATPGGAAATPPAR